MRPKSKKKEPRRFILTDDDGIQYLIDTIKEFKFDPTVSVYPILVHPISSIDRKALLEDSYFLLKSWDLIGSRVSGSHRMNRKKAINEALARAGLIKTKG